MDKIKVVYSNKQIADSGCELSPSAMKPKYFAELLEKEMNEHIEFVPPNPIDVSDIMRCHDSQYVEDIMKCRVPNGFGTISQSVVDSLPYTNGAMYDAASLAFTEKSPAVALVSGFHHAGWAGYKKFGYFCTFNGLMIAAMKLVEENGLNKIAIVDCDMHVGNGTLDIVDRVDESRFKYMDISFGYWFTKPQHAKEYLAYFDEVRDNLWSFKPDVILYQSGADVHVDDPYGGVLNESDMYERDRLMFGIAKDLNIPICWNLAGGYQKDLGIVLRLHLNTFKACREVFS